MTPIKFSVWSSRGPQGAARRRVLSILLASALAGLSGCTSQPPHGWPLASRRATFQPGNFVAPGPIPASVRRVAVLPLHSEAWRPADLATIEASCLGELAKFERFEITPLTRSELDARFGAGSFLSSAALPEDFLARLQADFDVQGVLFLDLAHFAPYQPVALALRAKLVATQDAQVVWSFDSMFDAAQPAVAEAARRYHVEQSRPAYPVENTSGILLSPARFAKYAAYAMFKTLPPRESR